MFYIHYKNAVKSYANDLTLIAATQIALKKIIVYMEEKYLVCYPVYKFQVTSNQPRYNERWDNSVSVCHNAILQTNILVETPGMHSASRMDQMASNAPLHKCVWNVHVDQGWKDSGITKVDHKKHVIWSNNINIFF